MSFLTKLFGIFRKSKKKLEPNLAQKNKVESGPTKESLVQPNPIQEIKDQRSSIQIIEEELGVLFPSRFKQFVNEKLPKDNSINIELLDGPYKFLNSLFNKDIIEHFENVIEVSNHFNALNYPEEKDFIKIPFAKSTDGDCSKYLYFIAEKHKEASEKIFLRDMDSPGTGRIPLCNQLSFVLQKVGRVNNRTFVTNTSLNFSEANSWIEIPKFINIWKDSYGINIVDEIKDDSCKIDLYLSNYTMDDKNENFSKIEVQVDIVHQNKRILSALAFEIDKSGLQTPLANNINYWIFYHKLVCIIGTFATLVTDLKKNQNIDIEEFLNTLDLQELTKQHFRGIEEQEM